MVRKRAAGICINDTANILALKLHEIIIVRFKEKILLVNPPVEDVVVLSADQFFCVRHC